MYNPLYVSLRVSYNDSLENIKAYYLGYYRRYLVS